MSRRSSAANRLSICARRRFICSGARRLALLATYYLGSVPFILGLLFFWADMSSSATARDHVVPPRSGMTVACIFGCSPGKPIFARGLRAELAGGETPASASGRVVSDCSVSSRRPALKLVALPVAAGLLVPFPEVYAFFHNASLYRIHRAPHRKLARLWPRENLTFLAILSLLSVVVFLNTGMAVVALPYLMKMLLGIDTVFTRSPYTFLNTTFLAIVSGLSYLVLNPFVKAFYVLRCFYGESLTTAEDLRVELRAERCRVGLRAGAVGACLAHGAGQGSTAATGPVHRPGFAKPRVRLASAAHVTPQERNDNWFVRSTVSFLRATDRGLKQVGHWIDDLAQWLGDRIGKPLPQFKKESSTRAPATQLRVVMVVLLTIVSGIVGYLLWRFLIGRPRRGDSHRAGNDSGGRSRIAMICRPTSNNPTNG